MRDRTKIELLIEEGAIRKIGEKKLYPMGNAGEGMEEIFELTALGEDKYFTMERAMNKIEEFEDGKCINCGIGNGQISFPECHGRDGVWRVSHVYKTSV